MKKMAAIFACVLFLTGCTSSIPAQPNSAASTEGSTLSGESNGKSTESLTLSSESNGTSTVATTIPTTKPATSGIAASGTEFSGDSKPAASVTTKSQPVSTGSTTTSTKKQTDPTNPVPKKTELGIELDSFLGGGFANNKDGWTYYSGLDALYKKKDGQSDAVKLTDGRLISNINVLGDWIYYLDIPEKTYHCSIFKMKTDGTQKQKIYTTPIVSSRFSLCMGGYLLVTSDYIFLKEAPVEEYHWDGYSREEAVYRLNLDGTGKIRLGLSRTSPWYYCNERIYMVESEGGMLGTLYSVDIHGENRVDYIENVSINSTLYAGFGNKNPFAFLDDYLVCTVYDWDTEEFFDYEVAYDGSFIRRREERFDCTPFPQLENSQEFGETYSRSHCIQIGETIYYMWGRLLNLEDDSEFVCGTVNPDGTGAKPYASAYWENPMYWLQYTGQTGVSVVIP